MIVVITVVVIMALISACWYEYHYFNTRHKNRISFKEALDLAAVPVITFTVDGKKFNFLLDTGSSVSHINKKLIDNNQITHEMTDYTIGVYGMDGINRVNTFCMLDLEYNGKTFTDAFSVNDLENAFSSVKQETGVTIHGIIGSSFMEKYKYVIDFKSYVAYTK